MLNKIITLDFISKYIGSILRHLLTLIAGILISSGILTQSQANNWIEATLPLFIGVTFYLWSQIGSWINKAKK